MQATKVIIISIVCEWFTHVQLFAAHNINNNNQFCILSGCLLWCVHMNTILEENGYNT